MLKRRIIPKLQLSLRDTFRGKQATLVLTNNFDGKRAVGHPLSQAKIFESQLADELILVDIDRSQDSWKKLLETLEIISDALATPITVGGGIKSIKQVQLLLERGQTR